MAQYANVNDDFYQPQGGDDFAQLQPFAEILQYDGGLGHFMEDLGPILPQQNNANMLPPQIPPPQQPPQQQRPQVQPQGRPVPIVEKIRPEGLQRGGKSRKRRILQYRCPVCGFVDRRQVECQDHIGTEHLSGNTYRCSGENCGNWLTNRHSLYSHARFVHNMSVEWRRNQPVALRPIKRRPPADYESEHGSDAERAEQGPSA